MRFIRSSCLGARRRDDAEDGGEIYLARNRWFVGGGFGTGVSADRIIYHRDAEGAEKREFSRALGKKKGARGDATTRGMVGRVISRGIAGLLGVVLGRAFLLIG